MNNNKENLIEIKYRITQEKQKIPVLKKDLDRLEKAIHTFYEHQHIIRVMEQSAAGIKNHIQFQEDCIRSLRELLSLVSGKEAIERIKKIRNKKQKYSITRNLFKELFGYDICCRKCKDIFEIHALFLIEKTSPKRAFAVSMYYGFDDGICKSIKDISYCIGQEKNGSVSLSKSYTGRLINCKWFLLRANNIKSIMNLHLCAPIIIKPEWIRELKRKS